VADRPPKTLVAVANETTRVPVNDLSRGALALGAELKAAFDRFLFSGRYVLGPQHDAFESELAGYVGVSHCVGLASGTDALELALLAVGCRPGDTILNAANCGGYTTSAAHRAGLRVRFADVDARTLCLSRETVEAALAPEVRAVVVTHLYGLLADVEEITALCSDRGIAVVEDCAQAVGARRGGQRAGSFADAATFSFYPTKNLGALGDGGAVCTDRGEVADIVRSLRQYGWGRKYEVKLPGGRNSRLDELQAGVLRIRIGHLDAWNEHRRSIVRRYAEALPTDVGQFVARDREDCVAHLAVALVDDRERVRGTLEAAGIDTDVHYPVADHRQQAWSAEYAGFSLPVTEHAVAHVVTVPCFPELTEDEIERVCEALGGL
jgi:dTDP-4-amino-4,6-dideoxygalactose transaminase